MNHTDVIKSPVISEKSVHLQNKLGKYTFEVHLEANKKQIKEAVESLFQVKVTGVATINQAGKQRRVRGRPGFTPTWKKAIVTLVSGQKIEGI